MLLYGIWFKTLDSYYCSKMPSEEWYNCKTATSAGLTSRLRGAPVTGSSWCCSLEYSIPIL